MLFRSLTLTKNQTFLTFTGRVKDMLSAVENAKSVFQMTKEDLTKYVVEDVSKEADNQQKLESLEKVIEERRRIISDGQDMIQKFESIVTALNEVYRMERANCDEMITAQRNIINKMIEGVDAKAKTEDKEEAAKLQEERAGLEKRKIELYMEASGSSSVGGEETSKHSIKKKSHSKSSDKKKHHAHHSSTQLESVMDIGEIKKSTDDDMSSSQATEKKSEEEHPVVVPPKNRDEVSYALECNKQLLEKWCVCDNMKVIFDSKGSEFKMADISKVVMNLSYLIFVAVAGDDIIGTFVRKPIEAVGKVMSDTKHFIFSMKSDKPDSIKQLHPKDDNWKHVFTLGSAEDGFIYRVNTTGTIEIGAVGESSSKVVNLSSAYEGVSDTLLSSYKGKPFTVDRLIVLQLY